MSLPVSLAGGQLDILDDIDTPTITVPLITPAWMLGKLIGLHRPPSVIILNRRVTGGLGQKSYPPIPDGLRLTLPFTVVGECDHLGDTFSNAQEGLESNLNYLLANAFLPVAPVRWARHTRPSGATFIGPVQFEDFPTDAGEVDLIETTLGLVFPQGLVAE